MLFDNGWEGVWIAYGNVGVVLLFTILYVVGVIFALCIVCEFTSRYIQSIHKYPRMVLMFLWERLLVSLFITEFLCICLCVLGFVLKN